MQLTLPPELEAFVQRQIRDGKYRDPMDLVLAAVKLLQAQDDPVEKPLHELQAEAKVGWDAYQRGEFVDGPTALAQIKADLHKHHQSSNS